MSRTFVLLPLTLLAMLTACAPKKETSVNSPGPIAIDPSKIGKPDVVTDKTLPPGSVMIQVAPPTGKPFVYETTISENGKYATRKTQFAILKTNEKGSEARLTSGDVTIESTLDKEGAATYKKVIAKNDEGIIELANLGILFGTMGLRYPNAPIGVGTIWQDTLDIQHLLNLRAGKQSKKQISGVPTMLFKLVSIEEQSGKKVAVIEYGCSGEQQLQNGSVTFNVSGTAQVDIAAAMPIVITTQTNVKRVVNGKTTQREFSAETKAL